MKRISIYTLIALATSTLTFAGGDIQAVEPAVEIPAVVEASQAGNFYAGIGYSYLDYKDSCDHKADANAFTALAGYNYNQYLAIEGRYTLTGDLDWSDSASPVSSTDDTISNIGIYLKPMYPVNDDFKVYGLLGGGYVTLTVDDVDHTENAWQWGGGASYAISEKMDLFVDYLQMYDYDCFDSYVPGVKIYTINVGLTYNF